MTRSSLIVLGAAAVFALTVLLSARSRRTTERHTFAWLLVCGATAALAIWRDAVDALASAMGIYYPPSALFFGASAALVWLVYRLSLQVSEQKQQLKVLAQEIALLNAESPHEKPVVKQQEKNAA